jgi:hypothetical protein
VFVFEPIAVQYLFLLFLFLLLYYFNWHFVDYVINIIFLLLYRFVNMLLIVCIPRERENGELFANNHLILKML